MTILEYLEAVKELLLTNPLVESFQIIRERMTTTEIIYPQGFLLVKANKTNSLPGSTAQQFINSIA